MNKKQLSWAIGEDRDFCANELTNRKVILGHSDTILGLYATISLEGVEHLNQIKKRFEKPYIVLLPTFEAVERYLDPVQYLQIEKFMRQCWPGPVTLLCTPRAGLPSWVTGGYATIGIRIPQHAGLLALLQKTGGLFSTSANISGQPVPQTLMAVDSAILEAVDGIIVNEDEPALTVSSTIIDITGAQPRVIRTGVYPITQLEQLYGTSFQK
ncbi:MAG: L-threonylcarbamoyladenylate synthase [Candidatus Babeliales bacterium]